MTIRYYLSYSFIEKRTLEKSIRHILEKNSTWMSGKRLLDIGCGSKPYKDFFEKYNIKYTGIDFKSFSDNRTFNLNEPDLYFDDFYSKDYRLSQFSDKSFDIVTAFQVLEHHEKPEVLFSEAARILKKKGFLLLTFPFIWELHEEPNDFERFTHYKISKLCKVYGLEVKEIIKRGGVLSTISQLVNISYHRKNIPYIYKNVFYLIFLYPFQLISYIVDELGNHKSDTVFLGYTILIQKVK